MIGDENLKTTLFRSNNCRDFIDELNEFIKDKLVIDIKYQTTVRNNVFFDSALVIYKEVIEE